MDVHVWAAAVVSLLLAGCLGATSHELSCSQYQSISEGMSLAEVTEAFGFEPTTSYQPGKFTVHEWESGGRRKAMLTFHERAGEMYVTSMSEVNICPAGG